LLISEGDWWGAATCGGNQSSYEMRKRAIRNVQLGGAGWVGLAALLLALGGCTSAGSGPGATPSKTEVRTGKADGVDLCGSLGLPAGCDLCDELGWYGDGVCDAPLIALGACAGPDPDCDCQAVFRWLQKDAYKSTAGRSTAAWPPHTTTTLEVSCATADGGEEVVASVFMANHGTAPGAVDASGTEILVEVKRSEPIPGDRATLLGLVDAFQQCECAPATEFLSMDALKSNDEMMKQILAGVTSYVEDHLVCAGEVTTSDVVGLLNALDFEGVLAALPSCSFAAGSGWAEGLDEAAQSVVAGLQQTLAGYHVCNNDAKLQAELFATYAAEGIVRACDNSSALCQGPAWFYTP
jgi:hypothetical protein